MALSTILQIFTMIYTHFSSLFFHFRFLFSFIVNMLYIYIVGYLNICGKSQHMNVNNLVVAFYPWCVLQANGTTRNCGSSCALGSN
jgi:hypothetical protein